MDHGIFSDHVGFRMAGRTTPRLSSYQAVASSIASGLRNNSGTSWLDGKSRVESRDVGALSGRQFSVTHLIPCVDGNNAGFFKWHGLLGFDRALHQLGRSTRK